MPEILKNFYEATSAIDLIYIVITIFSLIKCYKNGFILSILSMAKWLLSYIITLIIFPRVKPYLKDVVDNEYVLDIGLGITLFVIVIFLILMNLSIYLDELIKRNGLIYDIQPFQFHHHQFYDYKHLVNVLNVENFYVPI